MYSLCGWRHEPRCICDWVCGLCCGLYIYGLWAVDVVMIYEVYIYVRGVLRNVVCYVVSSILDMMRGYQYAVTPQKEGKRQGGEEWACG